MATIETSSPAQCGPLPANFEDVSDEESASNVKDFDLPPLYEKEIFDRKFIRHHSLGNNKVLKSRWQEFKANMSSTSPVELPKNNELHFCKHMVRRLPASRSTDYRKKLKPGPGVDFAGQRPIPNELLMKRGTGPVKSETIKINSKTNNTGQTKTGSSAVKDVKKRGKREEADVKGAKEKR